MKNIQILYSRVSTDEQNDGFSPADQKDKLFRYAEQKFPSDEIHYFHDDESGKTFERPKWNQILSLIKSGKGRVRSITFMKWDRFARNMEEAYLMIMKLRRMGVECNAIEQPLDFDVPESKIMLAVYLAVPEVDNDRRAMNIFNGIRRAKKLGRWMGPYLMGYKKARDEKDKPIMIPEGGKMQELVTKIFEDFASGFYCIEDLRRKANKEGLKISRNGFWLLLRNKGYIGKVFVPPFKNETAEWVQGIHQPIIDEQTFFTVQDLLLERKKKNNPDKYSTVRDELPLRGFLQCPQCGSNLTGSASRGKMGKRFFYYHCRNRCKERQPAPKVNESFYGLLKSIQIDTPIVNLFAEMLKKSLKANDKESKSQKGKIQEQLEKNKTRLKTAKTMRLDGELTNEEYREMKFDIELEMERLTREDNKLNFDNTNFDEQVDFCILLLQNIEKYFQLSDTQTKRKLLSSIFPSKLVYENKNCRTLEYNPVVIDICNEISKLELLKMKKRTDASALSRDVELARIEPSPKQKKAAHL